ncbi:hypothetical protein EVAR_101112_1 [Eumeta japonica]|uniref:Uncharacterized protein n=1 Tax=Eumeta variegata TaxID=151549 RepID=A0A4C2A4M0_EUMVA|nr:hypothetical protein EVAR_101112_1 [Eumeta japonica]
MTLQPGGRGVYLRAGGGRARACFARCSLVRPAERYARSNFNIKENAYAATVRECSGGSGKCGFGAKTDAARRPRRRSRLNVRPSGGVVD